MANEILFVPHNHFDPIWRRCFDRKAKAHGITLASYAEIEAMCIDRFLELAPRGYPFSDGQAAVWRKYLQRRPEALAKLREYADAGLLDVALAGEVVPDTNLSTAEGLVRNFLVAMPMYRELVGDNHPGLSMGWVEDAFGNTPNYPQILAGVGAAVACATSYRFCPEDVWVGIDGTKLPCYDNFPAVRIGAFEKHPPCPRCAGRGCDVCGKSGVTVLPGFNRPAIVAALEQAATHPGEWVGVYLLTEELLPDAALFDLLAAFNRKFKGRCVARLANPADLYKRYKPVLDASLAKRDATPTPELNPAMPGCYVTRIQCKQRTRSVAYDLVAAEAVIANRGWEQQKVVSLPPAFAGAWQGVALNQFHDAITGTHIDSAYAELMEVLDDAETVAKPYLSKAKKTALPPTFLPLKKSAGRVRFGKGFDIRFDRLGIVSILRNGVDVFGNYPACSPYKRPLRVAELLLEADYGDAWGQRIADFPATDRNSSQVALGEMNRSVETSGKSIRWKGEYRGGDPSVKKLKWTVTAQPSEDGERIDFITDVDWDTANRRLRVIIPVRSQQTTATYEVPFGFIDRTFDAAKLDFSQWRANTMEWPTLHWARKSIDRKSGVALLNKGLPCVRWMPGRFDLSLLRSPQWQFCAVEPGNYEFWDIDGQRDAGRHRFEYSIWPYVDGLSEVALTRSGYSYNLPQPMDPPFAISGDVVVTAWKPAQSGEGWILRLQNGSNRKTRVAIDFGRTVQSCRTNLLETPMDKWRRSDRSEQVLHKHGIMTILIK